MLPLAGKPLIQYQLELLKRHGIDDVILCLQVMPESFEFPPRGSANNGKPAQLYLRQPIPKF